LLLRVCLACPPARCADVAGGADGGFGAAAGARRAGGVVVMVFFTPSLRPEKVPEVCI
jgi:hypothetical protein